MTKRVNVRQDFVSVDLSQLLTKVKDLKADGYRFAQACATTMDEDHFEIIYSFDKEHKLKDFWPAFIYENEMHDLFGIKFTHMALDYEGKFFKVTEPAPWNPKK